jgi:hypothetical protein
LNPKRVSNQEVDLGYRAFSASLLKSPSLLNYNFTSKLLTLPKNAINSGNFAESSSLGKDVYLIYRNQSSYIVSVSSVLEPLLKSNAYNNRVIKHLNLVAGKGELSLNLAPLVLNKVGTTKKNESQGAKFGDANKLFYTETYRSGFNEKLLLNDLLTTALIFKN